MDKDQALASAVGTLDNLQHCLRTLEDIRAAEYGTRELSTAQTRLEEAILWLQHGISLEIKRQRRIAV